MDESIVKIDVSHMNECYRLYSKNPTLRQCRELLFSRLFDNGVTLDSPNETNFTVKPVFQEILNTHYLPFVKSVLDDYFVLGFSHFYLYPIRFDGKRVLVPRTLPYGSYSASIKSKVFTETEMLISLKDKTENAFDSLTSFFNKDNKEKQSKAYKKNSEVQPRIYSIIFDSASLPDINNGKLNSIVSTLIRTYKYQEVMLKFSLQAEYTRSFPKMVTRIREEKGNTKTSSDFDTSNLVDNELVQLKETQRNNLKLQSVQKFIECQEPKRKFIKLEDDRLDLLDIQDNIFQLPYGIELGTSSLPQATSNTSLLDFQIHRDRTTLVAFGIPASLSVGKDVSLKNAGRFNEVEAKGFYKTVKGYASVLEQAIQGVFDTIYPANSKIVDANEVRDADEKNKNEDEMREEKFRQVISIPILNDTLTPELINDLFEAGAIDNVERRLHLRLYAGLDI